MAIRVNSYTFISICSRFKRILLPLILIFCSSGGFLSFYELLSNNGRINVSQNEIPESFIKYDRELVSFNQFNKTEYYASIHQENKMLTQNVTFKKILFWTLDNENRRDYGVGLGNAGFLQAGCPVWQCEMYDKQNLTFTEEEHDAVVFFEPAWVDRSRPSKRSLHQRYVFWNLEAPGWLRSHPQWDQFSGFFNWTMTYRQDSDIVHPYGWITPFKPEDVPLRPNETQLKTLLAETRLKRVNYARKKTKLAAWFVSNCEASNGRNEYVERLQRFIKIDIYGKCGSMSCPRSHESDCGSMLQRDYKFYLAFENSMCVDYVTEKFFAQMRLNIIPIVIDLHDNHKHFAPPHSYINALDFPSVKALSDYLKLLDSNDTLYNEYFWWKKYFAVHDHRGNDFNQGFCELCAKLHNNRLGVKIYDDLTDWWSNESRCLKINFDQPVVNSITEEKNRNESYIWKFQSVN